MAEGERLRFSLELDIMAFAHVKFLNLDLWIFREFYHDLYLSMTFEWMAEIHWNLKR